MTPKLVSTIIPVYNRPELIVECIESVMAQTHRPIEVIVVDDGSTDETPKVLSNLEREIPELTVLRQPNSGPGAARERGRLRANGEFIQYLDSDDLLLRKKFELQIESLTALPEAVAAYGKTERVTIGVQPVGRPMRLTGVRQKAMFPEFLKARWWGTSTPLYKREALDQVGPWLTTINEEDWEYDARLASLGGELAYVDEFVSYARHHGEHLSDNGSTDPQKLADRCIARSRIYLHAKSYSDSLESNGGIGNEDWDFFSKSVFLLARQCALAGLDEQATDMVSLSIESIGRVRLKHRLFLTLASIIGWQNTAKLIAKVNF